MRLGNTSFVEEMLHRADIVSDLTGPRFEPQNSRIRDKRATVRPTVRFRMKICFNEDKDMLNLKDGEAPN